MNKLFISIVAIILLLVGCKQQNRVSKELSVVDSLLRQGYVDSAYISLRKITSKDLHSAEDSAYYALLYSQAAYRTYKPINSFERLNFCINYYSKKGDEQEKLAMAYYYKGMVLYDVGNIKEGVVYIKNAEYIADKTENLELRHKVYESLVIINEEAGDLSAAMKYAKKSLAVSEQAKLTNWKVHAYNNVAVIHSRQGQSDSAAVYIRRCMAMLNALQVKDRVFILNNIGAYFMQTDKSLAKKYFEKVIEISPMEEAYENLAQIYAKDGKLAQAEELLQKALLTSEPQVKCEIMRSIFTIQKQRGDYKSAVDMADRLLDLEDSILEFRNSNNVKAIQAEFDNRKSREEYEWKIAVSLTLIVALTLVAVIIFLYSRYKTYRTKAVMMKDQMLIKNYEQQVEELKRLGNDKEKEIESINRRREKLLEKHRDTLNRGYTLFSEIQSGKTTVLWKKHDFESVIEYYRLVDMEFVDLIEKDYIDLSPKYKFFLVLEHIGKTNLEIMSIMGIAEVSLRSVRSRINKKKS